eukprot:scaffold155604_cov22-Tisochrysis_lutea.AAC.1
MESWRGSRSVSSVWGSAVLAFPSHRLVHGLEGLGSFGASQLPPNVHAIAHGSFRALHRSCAFSICGRGAHAGRSQCSPGLLDARSRSEHNIMSMRQPQRYVRWQFRRWAASMPGVFGGKGHGVKDGLCVVFEVCFWVLDPPAPPALSLCGLEVGYPGCGREEFLTPSVESRRGGC